MRNAGNRGTATTAVTITRSQLTRARTEVPEDMGSPLPDAGPRRACGSLSRTAPVLLGEPMGCRPGLRENKIGARYPPELPLAAGRLHSCRGRQTRANGRAGMLYVHRSAGHAPPLASVIVCRACLTRSRARFASAEAE